MKEPCTKKLFQECGLLILVHTFEPSAVETQVVDFREFEVTLVYIVSSKTVRAALGDTVK